MTGLSPATALAGLMVRGRWTPIALTCGSRLRRAVTGPFGGGWPTTYRPRPPPLGRGSIPAWLKLVRQDAMLSVFSSADGISWTLTRAIRSTCPAPSTSAGIVWRDEPSATATLDNVRWSGQRQRAAHDHADVSVFGHEPGRRQIARARRDRLRPRRPRGGRRVLRGLDACRLDTAAPYAASWIAAGVGPHRVTALARDSDGAIVHDSGLCRRAGAWNVTRCHGSTSPTLTNWRLFFTPSLDHYAIVDRYVAEIYSLNGWALVGRAIWASLSCSTANHRGFDPMDQGTSRGAVSDRCARGGRL